MLRRTAFLLIAIAMGLTCHVPAAGAMSSARVYVVRAVPNLASADDVNLCMNGSRLANKLRPGGIAGPYVVHGRHVHVKLTRDRSPCSSTDRDHVIVSATFREQNGAKNTLVAGLRPNGGHFDHRCATGECAFTKYKNVGAHTQRRDTRVNVVHVADTGASPVDSAVNVSFRGQRRVRDLRNNGHASAPLDLRHGPLRWAVTGAAGTSKAGEVLASGRFSARQGHDYTLILWGPQNGRYHVQLMDRQVGAAK